MDPSEKDDRWPDDPRDDSSRSSVPRDFRDREDESAYFEGFRHGIEIALEIFAKHLSKRDNNAANS